MVSGKENLMILSRRAQLELAATSGKSVTLRQASLKGLINYGRFLKRFINVKRLINMNLFIWLSKNRFIINVLIENRFINHKRVHIYEPFPSVVK